MNPKHFQKKNYLVVGAFEKAGVKSEKESITSKMEQRGRVLLDSGAHSRHFTCLTLVKCYVHYVRTHIHKLQGFLFIPKTQSVTKSNLLQIRHHSSLLNKESRLAASSLETILAHT